jgi:PAS domain S-box-containing protein
MKKQSADVAESGSVNGNGKKAEQLRKLLQAVNKVTSLLLTTKEDKDLESLMMESMSLIGNSISVDRVHIWQYNKTDYDKVLLNRYCWLSDIGKQKKIIPKHWTLSLSKHPMWIEKYERGISINSPVTKMTSDDVIFFSELDVKSIVVIPLFLDNQLWGLFSADDCVNERILTEDELDILHSVSIMMASVITRHALVAKRTEDLTRQTTMLTTLLNTIPDCTFAKDLASRYLQCNNAMYEFFGKMPADIIGKTDEEIGVSHEIAQTFMESDWGVFSSGLTKKYELLVPRADGELVEMETIKSPLIINGKTIGLLGIARDISEFKEMERKIAADYDFVKDLQAEADHANQAKSQFLTNMSHEIRSPVNTILGAAEMLMRIQSLPPEAQNWINLINVSGGLLLGIIDDLLDISKIESGELKIREEEFRVASVINDIIQPSILHDNSKTVSLDLVINEDIPAVMVGDDHRIKQILSNLISNAFKFTLSGSVVLSIDFESDPDSDQVMLVISIKDIGIGMSDEQLNKVYEEYARFDIEHEYTEEGSGLGLSITKRLVELMDGSITISGKFSKGTEFIVRLPQRVLCRDALGGKAVESLKTFSYAFGNRRERRKRVRDIMPYGKVLVVDDAESNSLVTVGLLSAYKLQIETAESGFAAIKKINAGNTYDVIFMDHVMPIMDGTEATKHIRDLGYTHPIIALTANAVSGTEEYFKSNGHDAVVTKPVDIRLLTSVLNEFVRDKQSPEVLEAARLQNVEKTVS